MNEDEKEVRVVVRLSFGMICWLSFWFVVFAAATTPDTRTTPATAPAGSSCASGGA